MLTVVYRIEETPKGCKVLRQTPTGERCKLFRNTCYVSAKTRAEKWIAEERRAWIANAKERGSEIEVITPEGMQVTNERKHITQPEDWWDAFKAEADKQGISLAEWLGEAGKAQLPKRIAAKLSRRPPANRPRKSRQDSNP